MKAKDYYKIFKQNPTELQLFDIAVMMLGEIKAINEKRHCKTNSAFISIVDEMFLKWKAFAKLVTELPVASDGLERLLKAKMPEEYEALQACKEFEKVTYTPEPYHPIKGEKYDR